jgi:hypothetical protein
MIKFFLYAVAFAALAAGPLTMLAYWLLLAWLFH